ncbi:MAG: FprA family A-type flavoprotein, partial [Desulfurococcaceae archaeon]
ITYNSYLLTTSEGAVVFDTWKKGLEEQYIESLNNVVDLRDIRYIVVHHMEPDHSGCVKKLVEISNAKVLGHQLAGKMMSSFYNLHFDFKPINDNEEMSIGEYKIRFTHTPWLHWPETIMSYVVENKVLLSCDAFGSYGVFNKFFYDELDESEKGNYRKFMRKYFANIIGSYRDWVVKNMDKIASRNIVPNIIAPSHGLVFRDGNVAEILDMYRQLGLGVASKDKLVVIYSSMYGFVKELIEQLKDKITRIGMEFKIFGFTDTYRDALSEMVSEAYDSWKIIIATSAYDAKAFPIIRHVVNVISRKTPRNKSVVVIVLSGWGVRVGDEIVKVFKEAGYTSIDLVEFPVGEQNKYIHKILDLITR